MGLFLKKFEISKAYKYKKPHISVRLKVPGAGIEPARPKGHKILSLACLPIPPSRLALFENREALLLS